MPFMKNHARYGLALLCCSSLSSQLRAAPLITYRLDTPRTGIVTAVAAGLRAETSGTMAAVNEGPQSPITEPARAGFSDSSQAPARDSAAAPGPVVSSYSSVSVPSQNSAEPARTALPRSGGVAGDTGLGYPISGGASPQAAITGGVGTSVSGGAAGDLSWRAAAPSAQIDRPDAALSHGGGVGVSGSSQATRTSADPSTGAALLASASGRTPTDPTAGGESRLDGDAELRRSDHDLTSHGDSFRRIGRGLAESGRRRPDPSADRPVARDRRVRQVAGTAAQAGGGSVTSASSSPSGPSAGSSTQSTAQAVGAVPQNPPTQPFTPISSNSAPCPAHNESRDDRARIEPRPHDPRECESLPGRRTAHERDGPWPDQPVPPVIPGRACHAQPPGPGRQGRPGFGRDQWRG